ncbi:ATP-binding protein [Streptomyces sp. NRRL S-646]|uniref:ATP-binding protein n=1 Tax=Streptomyces sp. NRRL S-646 TaxID=1463917 RepID=UPI001331723E|nr:tetratricopeptide repeat protein [Streptomyces sp. NRRL S-646]
MGEHAERFWDELHKVYEEARRPTLERLVALGSQQQRRLIISKSTISDWLTRKTVPGTRQAPYFSVLAAFLQGRAVQEGGGYAARSKEWWEQLLTRAQEERSAARGGRPRTAAPAATPVGPVTLPPRVAAFTGRMAVLEELLDWLDPDGCAAESAIVVSSVAGMPGVGKTALAIQGAHQALERRWFPGGILFADLHGYSHSDALDSCAAADQFLRALGVRAKEIPPTPSEKQDALRLLLNDLAQRGRPLLMVLDNVRTLQQIEGLLPAPPHRALVTSRHKLSMLAAHHIDLHPLEQGEAVALLEAALRTRGTTDERMTGQPEAARRLADLCGQLPLALRIIAALLRDEPERPLSDQADELDGVRTRLDVMQYEGEDRPLAVRAAFELSYRHLSDRQARAFRLLSVASGPDISTASATALLGQPDARRCLADLARVHLLQSASEERWSLHDLLRLFATEHGAAQAEADQRDAARTRLLDHYLVTAKAAAEHGYESVEQSATAGFTERSEAVAWLDAERANLIAEALSAEDHPVNRELHIALIWYFNTYRHFEDWAAICNRAIEKFGDLGNLRQQAEALSVAAIAFREMRHFVKAVDAHRHVLDFARDADDPRLEAVELNNLGSTLREMRRIDDAINAHRTAAQIAHRIDEPGLEAAAQLNLATALRLAWRYDEALAASVAAADLFQEAGTTADAGSVLVGLGSTLQELGNFELAAEYLTEAADAAHKAGDSYIEAVALNKLGHLLYEQGACEAAIDALTKANSLFESVGARHAAAMALSSLGVALAGAQRIDDAVAAHSASVEALQHTEDRRAEAMAWGNLGNTLAAAQRFDEAMDAHDTGAAVFEELGDRHSEAMAMVNAGAVAHELGRPEQAAELNAAAAEVFLQEGDVRREAMALINLGRSLQQCHRLDESLNALMTALLLCQQIGDGQHAAMALRDLQQLEDELSGIRTL